MTLINWIISKLGIRPTVCTCTAITADDIKEWADRTVIRRLV